jgi:chromosome segregation protein
MRLSSIVVTGFKSFAKKTTLDITHDVTGIVGPNGSGKSNIAEAIRFVLGEQSMKNMRTKASVDLLYKGNSSVSPASKAVVSVVLDNREKQTLHKEEDGGHINSFLVYDEITLSRTLYKDGTSDYTINDAKVRLKDVEHLLALAGIGSTENLIISQGEADRVLVASPKERRELIEDALGLRIYHIRLRESRRKLEKTETHIHEVELLRKEIAPQLAYLHKEVSKLEKVQKEKEELARMAAIYLFHEHQALKDMHAKLDEKGTKEALSLELAQLTEEMNRTSHVEDGRSVQLQKEKRNLQEKVQEISSLREKLLRSIGRMEAEKIFIERSREKEESNFLSLSRKDVEGIRARLIVAVEACLSLLDGANVEDTKASLQTLRTDINSLFEKEEENKKELEVFESLRLLEGELRKEEEKEKHYDKELQELSRKILELEETIEALAQGRVDEEKKKREILVRHSELTSLIKDQERLSEVLQEREIMYRSVQEECTMLIGKAIVPVQGDEQYDRTSTLKTIERLKLRVEDSGIINSRALEEEYETLFKRDEYLAHELTDIRDTHEKLETLIEQLEAHIERHFGDGIKKVASIFNDMFKEVFKGGKATLSLIKIVNKVSEEEIEDVDDEWGIDIAISLPEKRIKDLFALSGGEKALTSIALSFALSQIAPPPFMVLDETDAALDESNARKYGLLLKKLALHSKLLVITHNRETMSHCDMLYGVTIGKENVSALLSISLKDSKELVQ